MTRINVTHWHLQRIRQFLRDNEGWHLKVIGFDVFVQRGADA